jgi:hypothetical protein
VANAPLGSRLQNHRRVPTRQSGTIVRTGAAFVQFCREQGLVGGRMVALDGTKIRAVVSPKNIAGAERLARDIEHTEREIAYYLDRLDAMDEQAAKGFGEQPTHREAFGAAIAALRRRKDRLAKRQVELDQRDEKVLVFGEPEAKPMGYAHARSYRPTTFRASSTWKAA